MKTQHLIITDTATGESFPEKHKIGRGGMGGTINLEKRLMQRIGAQALRAFFDDDTEAFGWDVCTVEPTEAGGTRRVPTGRRLMTEKVSKL